LPGQRQFQNGFVWVLIFKEKALNRRPAFVGLRRGKWTQMDADNLREKARMAGEELADFFIFNPELAGFTRIWRQGWESKVLAERSSVAANPNLSGPLSISLFQLLS
jgi:hypothetical protein